MYMQEKFKVNRIKIKEGCQSYTKAAPQESLSDLTLASHSSSDFFSCKQKLVLKTSPKAELRNNRPSRVSVCMWRAL